jgi:hypothetical protein
MKRSQVNDIDNMILFQYSLSCLGYMYAETILRYQGTIPPFLLKNSRKWNQSKNQSINNCGKSSDDALHAFNALGCFETNPYAGNHWYHPTCA